MFKNVEVWLSSFLILIIFSNFTKKIFIFASVFFLMKPFNNMSITYYKILEETK